MARMNREILVPYLQDVCALHLAKKKCQDEIAALRAEAYSINKREVLPQPTAPKTGMITGWMLVVYLGGIAAVCGVVLGFWGLLVGVVDSASGDGYGRLSDVLIIGGLITAVVGLAINVISALVHSGVEETKYQQKIEYWKQESVNRKANANAQYLRISNGIRSIEGQISVIDGLLTRAYSANLIPSRYRDIYAAVYLYDWFSTGMSDDMDMALNTYVLEQIKSRLDTIIRNQSEQIINQRTILANQARSMNMIERNAQEMRAKVSRMNESLEKQNVYLKMIDSNVAATRYFAEQTYKKWN